MRTVLLAGLGMQGRAALYDLVQSTEYRIVVADSRPDLQADLGRYPGNRVSGHIVDARDETALSALMRGADVVIEALPGTFALRLSKLAAECGVSLVNSMYLFPPGERDPRKIAEMRQAIADIDGGARAKGRTILTEFGLDPGLDILLAAKAIGEMDEVREYYSYGAGLPDPNARPNPLRYKFSWSIAGVMRAYSRPARIIARGQVADIPPERVFDRENVHTIEVEGIPGPLECFPNGDGVHYAALFGIRDTVRETGRFTCRYPGHCAFWEIMVKCGFLAETPIAAGGSSLSPLEFTAALLGSQAQFHYAEDERDLALIRVDVRGLRAGKWTRIVYQLLDWRDLETGFTSMQRTVGFTLSLGARLILEGRLPAGLLTPLDVPYDSVFPALARHNLHVTRREYPWVE
jgi:lysine 6-dehydrogenase